MSSIKRFDYVPEELGVSSNNMCFCTCFCLQLYSYML